MLLPLNPLITLNQLLVKSITTLQLMNGCGEHRRLLPTVFAEIQALSGSSLP